jgi:DNA-binding transcriptional ArsR family regulator
MISFEPKRDRNPHPRELCVVCSSATTGRKPFCIDHLEELPYVAALREELAAREAKRLNLDGSRAQELIEMIALRGAVTPKRLALVVDLGEAELMRHIRALERAGFVTTITLGSRRGTSRRIVTLTKDGELRAENLSPGTLPGTHERRGVG